MLRVQLVRVLYKVLGINGGGGIAVVEAAWHEKHFCVAWGDVGPTHGVCPPMPPALLPPGNCQSHPCVGRRALPAD